MQPVTLEKALELNLQQYAELPAKEREEWRMWVKTAANGAPEKHDRDFNAALLPLLFEVEARIQAAGKPTAPTAAETNAFLLWLAKVVGFGVVIIGGGIWAAAFIVGAGKAIELWASRNAGAIGAVIGGVGLLAGLLALPKWKRGESEESKEPGETTAQNQTIINVYSATGGDVQVNQK